jgi:hypothetical protein
MLGKIRAECKAVRAGRCEDLLPGILCSGLSAVGNAKVFSVVFLRRCIFFAVTFCTNACVIA